MYLEHKQLNKYLYRTGKTNKNLKMICLFKLMFNGSDTQIQEQILNVFNAKGICNTLNAKSGSPLKQRCILCDAHVVIDAKTNSKIFAIKFAF
jgi:hypothetical protein